MSITVFLPVRKGSQRVPNKNTRPFAEFDGGLLELKLKQLVEVQYINEIIVSTNDEACVAVAEKFQNYIKIDHRPDNLASSITNLSDLIRYVPSITESEHVLWTHVTSPFFQAVNYKSAIKAYFEALETGYDSLMSVLPFKNFLWDKEKNDLINRNSSTRWPQTQDLFPYYEIDSAVFMAPKSLLEETGDRVGQRPYLFENDKLTALDIDYEEDFKIAEAVYEMFIK